MFSSFFLRFVALADIVSFFSTLCLLNVLFCFIIAKFEIPNFEKESKGAFAAIVVCL